MEGIAMGLAADAVALITKVVTDRAKDEIRIALGAKDEFEKLKERFLYIQGFLNDLGNGNKHAEKSQLVNVWLEKVKEVGYCTDDLMDDYAYEMLRRKHDGDDKFNCHNEMVRLFWPIVFHFKMAHRVNQIMSELDKLDKEANQIGLNPVDVATKAVLSAPSSTNVSESDTLSQIRQRPPTHIFIGREDDQNRLLELLRNPAGNQQSHHLPIIAIVGIGGLGKTTLARHLYEHEVDEGPFNGQKIWICLSENFDVVRLLKEMVESVTKTPCELKNTGAIMGKLEENLKGKKLFLVLDDVWNNDKHLWDSFKSQLQKIGVLAGSVILVTTRSNDVAKKASASCLHELRGLWKEDGWALLKQQVSFDSSFNDVGRRILDKCKGVPLAIKAIGGILQLMESHSDWCRIEKSEVWEIQHHEDANYIMPSLLLSYNHFKHVSLKRCFALCAIFPKDKIMSKSELIYLWLAQGLIYDEPSNYSTTITAETIGENYIDILVNHSFLLECYETKYMMHDLVHDLASYVSKKDLVVCKGGEKLEDVDSHIQHLAFDLSINETTPEILIEKKLSKLRTIIFWRGVPRWNSLICAPYIRTLIMDNIGLSEVPAFIGQLLHLRYLDLSNNPIHALPESICKLYQLQTLRLFRCLVQELPSELHRLENLRHIETSRWLVASKGMGQLTSLQTLPYLKLCDREGWTIDELGPLYQVKGEINIEGLEYVKNKEEAREARLIRKDKILKLSFHWSFSGEEEVNYGGQINSSIIERCNHDKDVLESLEPHPNIQSLRIMGYMGVRFPRWMREMGGHPTTKLNSLTNVELYTCDRCLQLPSLGMLPNLKVLCLSELNAVECIGEEFYYSNNNSCAEVGVNKKVLFPNLRELSIMDFESLTTWEPPSSSATVLPSLETCCILSFDDDKYIVILIKLVEKG